MQFMLQASQIMLRFWSNEVVVKSFLELMQYRSVVIMFFFYI